MKCNLPSHRRHLSKIQFYRELVVFFHQTQLVLSSLQVNYSHRLGKNRSNGIHMELPILLYSIDLHIKSHLTANIQIEKNVKKIKWISHSLTLYWGFCFVSSGAFSETSVN